MARASAAGEAAALDGLDASQTANLIGFTGLNTGDPATTGANEYAGVTRQATSWNRANTSTGQKTNSGSMSFTTSGATPVTHFSEWSAGTSGTYAIGGLLASAVTAANISIAAGALTLAAS